MQKKIKKIINLIVNILLTIIIFVAIFLVYCTIQTKVENNDYPNIFGYTYFKVVTGSMADTINVGDVVIVKIKDNKTTLKEDEIIVFKQDNNMITHRIIKINKDKIITKGDANNVVDEPITEDNVIGTVINIIPDVGVWQAVFMTPQVFLSILITVILFGIVFSFDDKKEEKEEKSND